MSAPLPWSITDAREVLAASSLAQQVAENALREAVKTAAHAEEAYRRALAEKITTLRADGAAATTVADLARGDDTVARLRRARDIAEGVKEATVQAGWRASADRRDAQSLTAWSMRVDLRDDAEGDTVDLPVIGRRAA